MRKLLTMFGFFVGFLFSNYLISQNEIRCGTTTSFQSKMRESKFKDYRKSLPSLKTKNEGCLEILRIPLAFHFSGNITDGNMSCIQDCINNQIDVLNNDFSANNPDIQNYIGYSNACPDQYPISSLTVGTCLEFYLGTIDGDEAITFGENTVEEIGTNVYSFNANNFDGFLNIFISDIVPDGKNAGLLGFVSDIADGRFTDGTTGVFVNSITFGGDAYSCISGVQINKSPDYNLGRTLTHEVGHFFGLFHIFQGSSCLGDGDGINDTPPQISSNGGIPIVDITNCTSNSDNSCSNNDFFFNFMDYCFDSALIMFTSEQSNVIYGTALLGDYREEEANFSDAPCKNVLYADYCYDCGGNEICITVGEDFNFNGRNCGATSSGPTITTSTNTNNGNSSGPSGPGSPGGGGGGGGGSVSPGVDVPVINENDECQECVKELQRKNQILKSRQNQGN